MTTPQIPWQSITTINDVCQAYPDLVTTLRREINVGRDTDTPQQACKKILEHYRNSNTCDWLRTTPPNPGAETDETADKYADGWFNKKEFWHKLDRDTDAHLRWDTVTPEGGHQFFCNLNRHMMFGHLFKACRETGNPKYVQAMNQHMLDWFTFTASRNELDYGKQMQVALRVPTWSRIFYGTLNDPNIHEALHLLMLIHIPTQARHLIANPLQNNGLTMTINALLTCAVCWPEFHDAAEWERIGTQRLVNVTNDLIYPDGAAAELTSSYHGVTRGMIDAASSTLRKAGRKLPDSIDEKLRRAYEYTPCIMRPDGSMPLNNDSDRGHHRNTALKAAERYDQPDWQYMATNGEQGTPPQAPPSRAFHWAGHVVTRSDWSADAHWAFFDIGPWGTGHQHNDKLHLSIHAYGRDLLVDSGRFWYEGGPIRCYALSGAAHNTVMLDDFGQTPDRKRTDAPTPLVSLQHDFDFAMGRFDRGFGHVNAEKSSLVCRHGAHTRALVYLRGMCWLVIDRIESNEAETFSTLWHFHPNCTVETDANSVRTTNPDTGNLDIRPIFSGHDWNISLHQGREEPTPQGWYSEESYATWYKNTCAVYEAPLEKTTLCAWLLTPGKGTPPHIDAKIIEHTADYLQLQLSAQDSWTRDVTVRLENSSETLDLGNGYSLHGHCAVRTPDHPPQAACGYIEDTNGKIVHDDRPAPQALLDHMIDELHVLSDDSDEAASRQHFRVQLHNPLISNTLDISAILHNLDAVNGSVSPAQHTLAPGETYTLDITIETPADAQRHTAALQLALEANTCQANTTLALPLRAVTKIPRLTTDTDPASLFDNADIPTFAASDDTQTYGILRLAWLGDKLALAAELHDQRCSGKTLPDTNAPMLEVFADALAGRRPVQLILRSQTDTETPAVTFNHMAHPFDGPDIDLKIEQRDGAVRLSTAVPPDAFNLNPDSNGFWFDTAFITAGKGEKTTYTTLSSAIGAYLDDRYYIKAIMS